MDGGEAVLAERAESAAAGSDDELTAFLISNELWGRCRISRRPSGWRRRANCGAAEN